VAQKVNLCKARVFNGTVAVGSILNGVAGNEE
jgi:hypothetical protein